MADEFKLVSNFKPQGDQPAAIRQLGEGIQAGEKFQTLLGVTGSGKTYSLACMLEENPRPTLVISHNKTLAAQLFAEFSEFFPENATEYFVSYYDYFQPEAYVPRLDLYIEKETSINEKLEQMRMSTIHSLIERRDVIAVASVSCIFGAGKPEMYRSMSIDLNKKNTIDRDDVLKSLVQMQYSRNDIDTAPGTFRARGLSVDIFPSYETHGIRLEFFGDEIEGIHEFDPLTGELKKELESLRVYPAKNFTMPPELMEEATASIEEELDQQLRKFRGRGKLLEAQRLEQRTRFDLEMLREMGSCPGIENYSRHFDGRNPGDTPWTLIDYFPKDFLILIDESHATVPQIRAMYRGNLSRKETLINYGFRLPSALDNRPLNFKEFLAKTNQVIFVSATPSDYERTKSKRIVEQIVRPTGLIDPEIVIHKVEGQIDHLLEEIRTRAARKERILVTTLTKKMAENLADYLASMNVKTRYLHSEINTLDRVEILRDLRLGEFNVLVGINLLREGLDLPEVSLVAILDADKEGFLRSETALIQTMGRASRNINGKVILYADNMTKSMQRAIDETQRRRKIQEKYNKEHRIIPKSIEKPIRYAIVAKEGEEPLIKWAMDIDEQEDMIPISKIPQYINELELKMLEAAKQLQFELAAEYRDKITELKSLLQG